MTTPDQQETPSQPPAFDRKQAVREARSMSELEALVGETDITQALKEKAELAFEDLQSYFEKRKERGLRMSDVDTAARDAAHAHIRSKTAVQALEGQTNLVNRYDQALATLTFDESKLKEASAAHTTILDRIAHLRQQIETNRVSVGFFGRLFGKHSETAEELEDQLKTAREDLKVSERALYAISQSVQSSRKHLEDLRTSLGGLQGIEARRETIKQHAARVEELRARHDELTRAAEQDGFAPLLAHAEFFLSQLDNPQRLHPTDREAVVEIVNHYIDTATARGELTASAR